MSLVEFWAQYTARESEKIIFSDQATAEQWDRAIDRLLEDLHSGVIEQAWLAKYESAQRGLARLGEGDIL